MLFALDNKEEEEEDEEGGGDLGVKEKRRKWGIKVFGRCKQISSFAFSGSSK